MRTAIMRLVVLMVAGLLSQLSPRPAEAASYGGEIESVSSTGGSLTIKLPSSSETKTIKAGSPIVVTLDGKKSTLAQLKPGLRVAVLTDKNGAAIRVSATSAASTTATTPAPKTITKPDPPSSTGTRPAAGAANAGWHQFAGPNRDNISPDTGLLKTWPADGPQLLWTTRGLGEGFSSVSISNGLIYTLGSQGAVENLYAIDLENGNIRWTMRNGNSFRDGRGSGPRSTPTVDGNRVYALGGMGDLSCFDAASGRAEWQLNILQQFGGSNITWGICESPLIDGEKLICTPGGSAATMVALNKTNGRPIWTSIVPRNPSAAYASAIVADVGGVRQYINFTGRGIVGIKADDGSPLWGDDSASNGTANCSTPLYYQNHVFYASGYGTGGTLLRLQSSRTSTTAAVAFHTDDMKNHHGDMVIVDGYLYGSNDPGVLVCIDLKNGNVAWQNRSVGKGSIVCADGHLYLRSENGPVALIEVNPREYVEKGRFSPPDRGNLNSWAHPVVAEGKLFLRDQDVLQCYDLRGSAE